MDTKAAMHENASVRIVHEAVASSLLADWAGGILLAYSGGIDSTVLLYALAAIKAGPLRILHVVHNLRPVQELALEREQVIACCRALGLPLRIAAIPPGAIEKRAKLKKIGIEAAAREFRYGILAREAERSGCGTVCTAHNADDQLETLIGRFIASSSFEGLKGMPRRRSLGKKVQLCRPLLSVPRSLIEAYAAAIGLKFSRDSTNDSSLYLRNKIRSSIVPVLDREFSGWRKGLETTAQRLASDGEALSRLSREAFLRISFSRDGRSASLRLADFLDLPESLRIRLLAGCLRKLSGKSRLSFGALREASRSIAAGCQACDLLGYRVVLDESLLRILPILDFRGEGGYFFHVEGAAVYRAGRLEVLCSWQEPRSTEGADMGAEPPFPAISEAAFSFPLTIRSRRPGDRIRSGDKDLRIDELLSSWGIEGRHRDFVPIAEDRQGIVAVLPGSMEGLGYSKLKFRDCSAPLKGRSFVIRIKGAVF